MLRFAAIGLDHRHIYDLVAELIAAGAHCAGYCAETSDAKVLEGFRQRFPAVPALDRRRMVEDPSIDIVCTAAIPRDRAGIAIDAMRHGKDVMADKPGITNLIEYALALDPLTCIGYGTVLDANVSFEFTDDNGHKLQLHLWWNGKL